MDLVSHPIEPDGARDYLARMDHAKIYAERGIGGASAIDQAHPASRLQQAIIAQFVPHPLFGQSVLSDAIDRVMHRSEEDWGFLNCLVPRIMVSVPESRGPFLELLRTMFAEAVDALEVGQSQEQGEVAQYRMLSVVGMLRLVCDAWGEAEQNRLYQPSRPDRDRVSLGS
jgi:hypothetical protein